MAKNMARLEDNIVVNIEWCSNNTNESETLKEINDCKEKYKVTPFE